MYRARINGKLDKTLQNLRKRDNLTYENVKKKMREICHSADPHHYKSLKHELKGLKRVHIGHFVLIFWINDSEKEIEFLFFGHHEEVYRRRE